MHITTRFKCDYPLKIGYFWHLNEKKSQFMKSNRYILSRFEVYIRIGVHEILLQQKRARCYPRSLMSSCRFFRHLRMVENVGDLLNAIPSPLTYQAI